MLVDDERDSRELYRQLLEWAGFDVDTAASGLQALQTVRTRIPDVIVLDVLMPGMDGGAVADYLKRGDRTRSIPIVALTGVPEWLQDHRHAGSAAFDAIVLKPATAQELTRVIKEVVEARQGQS